MVSGGWSSEVGCLYKQKTAYEMRISYGSSDGYSSGLWRNPDHPWRRSGAAPGRAPRRDRPQRRWQVHGVPPDLGPADTEQGAHPLRRPGHPGREPAARQPPGAAALVPDHESLSQAFGLRQLTNHRDAPQWRASHEFAIHIRITPG